MWLARLEPETGGRGQHKKTKTKQKANEKLIFIKKQRQNVLSDEALRSTVSNKEIFSVCCVWPP